MRKAIEGLPPSAKLVFKVLEYGGLLTQKEIAEQSYLPPRTIRYALGRLKDEDFLQERFYFKDARQSLYGLKNKPDMYEETKIPVNSEINSAILGINSEKYELSAV
ncbi:winged helix-turn-helix transcriptional regulator [Methanococcoides seepicolus]|uniref:Winged helix-turn-helix transcriptional regulator n=1 Tax=Methanococcoides seepicolus TaxID=2828780 RepID=A0A9E5DBT7_9EURY|nr:winged helix-turn-helix transcriptional regulator [Methanococcoides seepicolus]